MKKREVCPRVLFECDRHRLGLRRGPAGAPLPLPLRGHPERLNPPLHREDAPLPVEAANLLGQRRRFGCRRMQDPGAF